MTIMFLVTAPILMLAMVASYLLGRSHGRPHWASPVQYVQQVTAPTVPIAFLTDIEEEPPVVPFEMHGYLAPTTGPVAIPALGADDVFEHLLTGPHNLPDPQLTEGAYA